MKKPKITLTFALIFSVSNLFSQTVLTLQPDSGAGKDAILHGLSSETNTNYGDDPQFTASAWTFDGLPGVVRAAIDFDLSSIPEGSVIESAYLSLYAWGSEDGFGEHSDLSGSNNTQLSRITSSWDESTVNWSNQPSISTDNQVELSATSNATADYENIDVAVLVQDMIDNASTSHGFLYALQDETYYRMMNFASSDHQNSQLHPKLVITYTAPEVLHACFTLQPGSELGKDAYLHGLSTEVDNNFGDNPQFIATAWTFDGIPGVVRSVLDFDLSEIPSGSIIDSAYLSLYAWDSTNGFGQHSTLSGSNEAWLNRITSAWDENTVTWSNQPTSTSDNQVELLASDSATQNYENIAVADLVQDMIDNPSSSFGFLLQLQDESYYRMMNFASSDHIDSTLRPKLEVCYTKMESLAEIISLENEFRIFPNPATNSVTVNLNNFENTHFEIFNSTGQIVNSQTINSSMTTVDVSTFSKGIYFIKLYSANKISTKKLIIE